NSRLQFAPLLVNPPVAVPSQSVTHPASLRSRMSARPSPLKSPVAITCQSLAKKMLQLAPLLVNAPLPLPLPSQSVTQPALFFNRKSSTPSPLKSPVPMTFQSLVKYCVAVAPLLVNPPLPLALPTHSVSQPPVESRSRKS